MIATVTDAELGIRGFILGVVAIGCTVVFQLSMEKFQKVRNVSGIDMQLMIAPWQLLAAVVMALWDEIFPLVAGIYCASTVYSQTLFCRQVVRPTADQLTAIGVASLGSENEKIRAWNELWDTSTSDSSSQVILEGLQKVGLWIFLSCLSAQMTNYYCYSIIGKFSAITYQVVAHSKTILVLTCGIVIFSNGKHLDMTHISGLIITVLGIIHYSYLKMKS